MFRHVSELMVKASDLVEAEGRLLRSWMPRVGMGIGMIVASTVMVLCGLVLVLGGIWLCIDALMGPPWGPVVASLVTGLLALGASVGLAFGATRLHK